MRLGLSAIAFVILVASGCNDEATLVVDLRTDLRAPTEFTTVRTTLVESVGGAPIETMQDVLVDSDDLLTGIRIAEIGGILGPDVTLRVELLRADGAEVVSRDIRVDLVEANTGVTAVITRDCRGVMCPGAADSPSATACLGGRCVDPGCTPETPELCGVTQCEADGDCAGSTAACAQGVCLDGTCLAQAMDASCSADQWCNANVGCVDLGPIASIADVAPFTTDSDEYVDVPGGTLFVPPSATDESWLLLVSSRLAAVDTGNGDPMARYLIDGVERGTGATQTNGTPTSVGPWMHFHFMGPSALPRVVQVQLRRGRGDDMATIDELHLIALAVPAEADAQFTQTEALRASPETSYTAVETLALTPSSPGDYLILAVANGSEGMSTGAIRVRFRAPDGATWPGTSFINDRGPLESFFLARVAAVDGPVSLSWEVNSSTGGGDVAYTRILAMRADAFARLDASQTLTRASTTSATPTTLATLDTSPDSAGCVAIQSQVILSRADSGTVGAELSVDGAVRVGFTHVPQNPQLRTTYGTFSHLDCSAAHTLENRFSSTNGMNVSVDESVIAVITPAQ